MKLFVALTLLAVLLIACDNGEEYRAASPTVAPTEIPAQQITPIPTLGVPSPVATIVRQPPEFAGFSVGEPVEFPLDIELFTWDGCTSCDGPPSALVRVRRTADGFDRTVVWGPESGFILDAWVEGDGLYVIQCESGTCGFGATEPPVTGQVVLYGSMDGGDSWSKVIELGLATETGELIYPSSTPRPHGIVLSADGAYVAGAHTVELDTLDDAERYTVWNALSLEGGSTLVDWIAVISEERGSTHRYLSVFDGSEHRQSHLSNGFSPSADLGDGLIIGLATYGRPPWSFDMREVPLEGDPGEAWLPSILDLGTGTVHPILEHFAERPINRNSVVGIRHLN